jgi:hypothetical protein
MDESLAATSAAADKASDALNDLAKSAATAAALGAKGVEIPVLIDDSKLAAQFAAAVAKVRAMAKATPVTVKLAVDTSAAAVMRAVTAARAVFAANPITVPVQFSSSTAAVMRAIVAARAAFRSNPITIPLQFSVSNASMMRVVVAMRAFFAANPITVPVNVGGVGSAALVSSLARVTAATNAAGAAAGGAGMRFRGFWGVLGLFFNNTRVPLFGGLLGGPSTLLGGVAAWHVAIDAVAEFLAVIVPASIAVAAFGVGAAPVVADLTKQLQNMNVVTQATGGRIAFMNGAVTGAVGPFQKLQDAVKPQVYQIFGDALTIMSQKTGVFSTLAHATGTVLDQLAARFTVATQSGGTFTKMLHDGPQFVGEIGDTLGNLGRVIGAFIQAVPGYAGVLLNLFDGLTRVAAVVADATVPVLHWGLAFHGAFLYIGLAVSAVAWLGPKLLAFGTSMAGLGGKALYMGTQFVMAARSVGFWNTVMSMIPAGGVPFLWVAGAAVAVGALGYALGKLTDRVGGFYSAEQQLIQNAPLGKLLPTISQAQIAGLGEYAAAVKTVNGDMVNLSLTVNSIAGGLSGGMLSNLTTAAGLKSWLTPPPVPAPGVQNLNPLFGVVSGAEHVFGFDAPSQAQQQNSALAASYGLVQSRVSRLGDTYKGTANAETLLNQAGITTSQMLNSSTAEWAVIQAQVHSTYIAYKAMGATGGTLGNDLQILNRQSTDAYTNMQSLNSALDTWIGQVTAPQTGFDTFAQGIQTLGQNFVKAGGGGASFTTHLAGLSGAGKLAHATMDGLNKASLQLNAAFAQQVTATSAMFDTWRTAGVSNDLFTKGVKASIAPLLKYASGSQEALDQLTALAQEAGYNGPANMKSLTTWLGKTGDALKTVKNVSDQATQQVALLSSAMNGQGQQIATQLLGDLNNAILKYSGVASAVAAYGKAVATQGAQSDAAHTARQRLITDLVNAGQAAKDSVPKIAAMITKILGIPTKVAVKMVLNAEGGWAIHRDNVYGGGPTGPSAALHHQGAAGWRVPGYGGGDKWPALLEGGETVVPKHLTHLVAPLMKAHGVPGFATGGFVETGNQAVASGQAEVSHYNQTLDTAENALKAAVSAAVKAAAMSAIGSGAVGGDAAANQALAQRMYPQWGTGPEWAAWDALWTRESGWSRYARNPSSGAYGLPQALPPTKMPFAAQQGGGSHAGPQISWGAGYIAQRYGDPIGAMGHESSYGWYSGGTRGAKRGWGWVGEKGPELVRFHGGEHVLDHETSKMAAGMGGRGYASGTVSLVETFLGLLRAAKDAAQAQADGTRFLRLIARDYTGAQREWRDRLVRRQSEAMMDAAQSLKQVNAKISAAKSYASSVTSGLSSYADVSGLTVGGGFSGNTGGGVRQLSGGGMLEAQLKQKLSSLRQFSSLLGRLVKARVPKVLLQQIIALGPDGGIPFAQEILSGGSGLMKSLRSTEWAITETERQIGRGAGSAITTGKYDTGKGFLDGLRKQRSGLERLFRDLGKVLGQEAVRWFGVPRGKRHGFAHGGLLREPVTGFGAWTNTMYTFAENGPELISAAPGGGARNGALINIENATFATPTDAALLAQKLSFAVVSSGLGS